MRRSSRAHRHSKAESHRPTVLVADDEIAFANVLARYCNRTWRALPVVTRLAELEPALHREHADVILLDVMFPWGESSVPLLPRLCRSFPDSNFIIHTAFPERAPVRLVLAAGASGYLLKTEGDGLPEVGRAIREVLDGKVYVQQSARAQEPYAIDSTVLGRPIPADWDRDIRVVMDKCGFSRASAEVAVLLHHGVIPKAIASWLGISLHGVRGRFRQIYQRHGLRGANKVLLLIERTLTEHDR